MKIIDKIKQIEKYICENFEEWDLEDSVEEYLDDYHEISGASEIEIVSFEKKIGITLPNDVKEIYKYKNESKYLSIFPCIHRWKRNTILFNESARYRKYKGIFSK